MSARGYRTAEITVRLQEDVVVAERVTLEPLPAKLTITSAPRGADVVSDGKVIGTTPLTIAEVAPGEQVADLRLLGYQAQTVRGEAEPGGELRLSATLEKYRGSEPGQPWTIPDLGLTLLPIASGTFTMGSENGSVDEKPITKVTITQPFWMGKTEVTQREWQAVMGDNPSNFKGDDLPVEQVSWTDAMEFCQKLTTRERAAGRLPSGYAYTLPTEAQWEYACRSGTTGDYAGEPGCDGLVR